MNKVESISTGNSLIKTCNCVLDAIYSSYDCANLIKTLKLIENNLFKNYYENFISFKNDLLEKIPQVSESFIDSINLSDDYELPEEYSNTPIYSSIQLKKESKMYTVNIKSHHQLHSSIYDAMNQPTNSLHRLYITKERKLLLEARDSIHSILSLFFDVEIQPYHDDSNISCIKAKVATVHPLGDFHNTESEEFDGWMKVKIVHTNSINTKLPNKLAHRLFEKRQQSPRKITFKSAEDVESAHYNELTRKFIQTVMNSYNEYFDVSKSLPIIENMMNNKNTTYTPIMANSNRKLTKTNITTNKSSQASTNNNRKNKGSSKASSDTTEPSKEITQIFGNFWRKLENFSYENNTPMVHKSQYDIAITRNMDASGYFKHVYFTDNNDVVQVFQRSTASQRIIEIASLLALKDQPCIGRIKEVIYSDTEVIGLTMDRYEMTLKEYLHKHTHQRLTAEERMHIVVQMLESINVSHQAGIAHRDLSTVNFMINSDAKLYLIDFGKAVFFFPRDAKKWWVSSDDSGLYKEDVQPASRKELAIWCRNLPYVMARPDHGYRFYRSIQTLPKSQKDRELLPYLIDPAAEDIYSLGTMIWKIFSGIEPWPGVFDTDLKKLRETVSKDSSIDRMLERNMPGPMCIMFLQMFLRVEAKDRKSAADILNWIKREDVKQELLNEWSINNGSRRTAARNNVHCRSNVQKPAQPVINTKLPKEASTDTNAGEASRRTIGRPHIHPIEQKSESITKKPVGRPRKEVTTSRGRHTKQSSPESTSSLSLCYTHTSSSAAPHHQYIVTEDGVKRFAKTGIPVGRPKPSSTSDSEIVKKEHIEVPVQDEPKKTLNKPYKYKTPNYIPTGNPRGRPKKKQRRPSTQSSTSNDKQNSPATETNISEELPNELINKVAKEATKEVAKESPKELPIEADSEFPEVIPKAPLEEVGIIMNKKLPKKLIKKFMKVLAKECNTKNSSSSGLKTSTVDHNKDAQVADINIAKSRKEKSVISKLKNKNESNSKTTAVSTSPARNSSTTRENSSASTTELPSKDLEANSKKRKSFTLDDTNNTTPMSSPNKNLEAQPKKRKTLVLEDINSTASKDKPRPELYIKLPGQPTAVLNKETIELVGRGSLSSLREPTRFTKSVRSSPSTTAITQLSKTGLSPPSPQSPLLSPSSNTGTVEETSSPPSPLPGKRKLECEHEKSVKCRHIENTEADPMIGADEFDLALYNILQELGIDSKRS